MNQELSNRHAPRWLAEGNRYYSSHLVSFRLRLLQDVGTHSRGHNGINNIIFLQYVPPNLDIVSLDVVPQTCKGLCAEVTLPTRRYLTVASKYATKR